METIGASERNSWRADATTVDLTRVKRDRHHVTATT